MKLQREVCTDIAIGSDDEKAIWKALKEVFPDLLCTRHLKENTRKYMADKVGLPTRRHEQILGSIFETESALIAANDSLSFELREEALMEEVSDEHKLGEYLKNKLIPQVKEQVSAGRKNYDILWTNNATESMNNVIKQMTNWTPQKLPELIEKLHTLVRGHYADLRRALAGQGNYKVIPELQKMTIAPAIWDTMKVAEKDRMVMKFLKAKPRSDFVISTDQQIKVPKVPSISGKKPQQRKRKRAERTISFK